MILVDTSVWADHFRAMEPVLALMLSEGRVANHPFVTGELAMGNLRNRPGVLTALSDLPQVAVTDNADWLAFVDRHALGGTGLGFVDAHLLASVSGHDGLRLWTRDRRLGERAAALGLVWTEPQR